VALVAGALGLTSALSRRQPEQAAAPTGTMPQPGETSGPAASPSKEVLAGRIEPAPGTRPEVTANDDFYRIDIDTRAPQVDAGRWQLELGGLVNNSMTLTLQEIRSRPSVSQYITLSCISNPIAGDLISTSLFTGLRLKDLLDEAGLSPQAQELFIESTDGFFESVSMEDMMDPRTLLVYEMNGQPLPAEHGYPLRIYIPNRFGMKQPKWIIRMKAIAGEGSGYWVERGWSKEAIVRTTSVIDKVTVQQDGSETALAGGIAYAGARGISKVEIQIDDGPWTAAELRDPPLSPLAWVQWRHRATVQPGDHVARVRAYDGGGKLQVLQSSPSHPDGATGIDSLPFRTR
jgi:DMSO/TMAO reductase YedYZ molybdopterin-dependent catalytic subunit